MNTSLIQYNIKTLVRKFISVFCFIKELNILARLISCSACGRVHSKGYVCSFKKKHRREKIANRMDTDIYATNHWRKVRAKILEGCNYICLYTLYKEGKVVKAECVHHITEILEDDSLAYEEDNLIALSNDKHKLIHDLYKEDKKKVQNELRIFKDKWKNGERGFLDRRQYPPTEIG